MPAQQQCKRQPRRLWYLHTCVCVMCVTVRGCVCRLVVWLSFNAFPDFDDASAWEGSVNKLGSCMRCKPILDSTEVEEM